LAEWCGTWRGAGWRAAERCGTWRGAGWRAAERCGASRGLGGPALSGAALSGVRLSAVTMWRAWWPASPFLLVPWVRIGWPIASITIAARAVVSIRPAALCVADFDRPSSVRSGGLRALPAARSTDGIYARSQAQSTLENTRCCGILGHATPTSCAGRPFCGDPSRAGAFPVEGLWTRGSATFCRSRGRSDARR
jgi:hypothetical protein